jgi:SDR family mycofactocin-dependent oxidoreductase
MGRLDDKVAFVTGAARGQGRAHAIGMAREGADIIAVDLCSEVPEIKYEASTSDDLAETVRGVAAVGRRILAVQADCCDSAAMEAAAHDGAAHLGGIDIAVIGHGIHSPGGWRDTTVERFDQIIEVNLSSFWRTARAVIPHIIARGGGSLMMTASVAGQRPSGENLAYATSKAAVISLVKSLAIGLGPHNVRVNAICPGSVATPMLINQQQLDRFSGRRGGTIENMKTGSRVMQLLPIPWLEPEDVANAAIFLASDEGRYISGIELVVDGGYSAMSPSTVARRISESSREE